MALDEALLARAREAGDAVLRVYGWSGPALSLGRHQTALGAYDRARAASLGVAVVRRLTGGRAVLHHREITYSVTAPVHEDEPLRESYGRINRLLLDGLRRLGVEAALAEPDGRAAPPGSAPCIQLPAEGEIVHRGRMLFGSAQLRDAGALLQHGSILIDDDQTMLASLATVPLPTIPPAATLRAALGRAPSLGEAADALLAAVRALEDEGARRIEPDAALRLAADAARERYLTDDWTWRR
jgi:lipoate-protein ligase A